MNIIGFNSVHIACKFHDITIFLADATLKIFQGSIVSVSQESIDFELIT
ncbi:hypothetical protein HOF65_02665 [bacterium]|nr:hypothetical protein [bacterium]MBT3852903.1 hypothetical protein [bacterium]MBT4633785.1 hypothetical protein [bacterium]MBT6779505.1 hypothetical protein [bacterium]